MQPTVLIGFNEYGLRLLQGLLISASDRGVLRWTRDAAGHEDGRLQLRDLAVFVCSASPLSSGGSSPFEEDLFRQIRSVPERDLRQEVLEARDRLLGARRFVEEGARGQYSLDVIVLAHPAGERDFRTMRETLERVISGLAADPNFRAAGEGNDALSMIQILDFEKYWDTGDADRRLTETAAAYVAKWQERAETGEPGCSRIYFADSNAAGGYRPAAQRIQEALLFLELVLFEEQRDDVVLRYLVQRRTRNEPIAASFGVRVVERQLGLMKRLAAALFSYRWLHYMAGQDFPADRPQGADIREALAHLRTNSLATAEELAQLDEQCRRKIEEAIPALLSARSVSAPVQEAQPARDHLATMWVRDFEKRTRARLDVIRTEVETAAGIMLERKTRATLENARGEIRDAATAALQHSQYPVPAGKLIQDLREVEDQLRGADRQSGEAEASGLESAEFERIRKLYSDYLWFKSQQLNPVEAGKWAWIWPVALAACYAPLVALAAQDFPAPDPNAAGLSQILAGLKATLSQILPAWLMVLACGALAVIVARRALFRRHNRGIQVHAHETQGRIRAACAALLQSPELLHHLTARVRTLAQLRTNRVRSEVLRELSFAQSRLQVRRNELDWLSSEMRRFCVRHGIDPDDPRPSYRPPEAESNIYTYWVAQNADYSNMVKTSEGQAPRFQALQAAVKPFEKWLDKYCPTFLHPVQFIDWLCDQRAFELPDFSTASDAHAHEWVEDLSEKVGRIGLVPLGFRFEDRDQEHEQERLCLLPEEWRNLTGLAQHLQQSGLASAAVHAAARAGRADRAYFLSYKIGVEARRLTRTAS